MFMQFPHLMANSFAIIKLITLNFVVDSLDKKNIGDKKLSLCTYLYNVDVDQPKNKLTLKNTIFKIKIR